MTESEFRQYLGEHQAISKVVLVEDMDKYYLFSYFEDNRQEKATKKGVFKYLKGLNNYDMVLLMEDVPGVHDQFPDLFGDSYYIAETKRLLRSIPKAQPNQLAIILKDLLDIVTELEESGNRMAELVMETQDELEALETRPAESPFGQDSPEPLASN
jgi:hypothetical protein